MGISSGFWRCLEALASLCSGQMVNLQPRLLATQTHKAFLKTNKPQKQAGKSQATPARNSKRKAAEKLPPKKTSKNSPKPNAGHCVQKDDTNY